MDDILIKIHQKRHQKALFTLELFDAFSYLNVKDYFQVNLKSIELDENRVQCVLVTENTVLEEEQKEIGESCAKKISDNVEMKAKRFHETNADVGELYNYYGLYLNLIVSEKGESLQGVKSSSNEEVEWSKVTY